MHVHDSESTQSIKAIKFTASINKMLILASDGIIEISAH